VVIYRNDASGDALRRMEGQGDDLTRPRNIDFTVAFPDGSSAEQFAEHFRALGHEVSVELTETDLRLPLGCSCGSTHGAFPRGNH